MMMCPIKKLIRNVFQVPLQLLSLSLIISFVYFASPASAADPSDQDEEQTIDNSGSGSGITYGTRRGRQGIDCYSAMEMDPHCSSRALLLESEQAWRSGDIQAAYQKIKKSLDVDNDDMDAHVLYANIIQEQLNAQQERDPTLFNKCVEEWLNIMRNKYGEEKNMRFHGINPFGDLYHDEERSILAKTSLIKLTGYAPKTFETDAHYLKRVLLPANAVVSGAVVSTKQRSAN